MSTNHLTLDIGGMNCGACVAHVRKALERLPGTRVANVRVGSADIVADSTITEAAIRQAIAGAGYELTGSRPASEAVSSVRSARSASGGCCGGGGHADPAAATAHERHPTSRRRP